MKNTLRATLVTAKGYEPRIEQFEGRDHLVVPVIALVEGVLHAMNAPNPEFVAAEEFSRFPGGWNGRPLFEGHPLVDGVPVSGNHPEVLENRVGLVFGAEYDEDAKKLRMEAWIDIERAKEKAPKLLERAESGADIEISVGVFVATDETTGEFDGKKWAGAWHGIVPDHLALLVEGDTGACSRKMGCGVRSAAIGDQTVKQNFLTKMLAAFRTMQPAAEMSSNDLSDKIYKALIKIEPSLNWVQGTRPALNPTEVMYTCYTNSQAYPYSSEYKMFRRDFSLSDSGEVTVGDERYEIEPVMSYPDVTAASTPQAEVPPAEPKAASGGSCSCHAKKEESPEVPASTIVEEGDNDMKPEFVEFLKTATAEQLAELGITKVQAVETPAAVVAPVAVAPVVEPVTLETLMAQASPDVRAAHSAAVKAAADKRTASVAAIKATGRNTFTDEALAAMEQSTLDNLLALAAQAPVVVDYALAAASQAAPRTGANAAAPKMPSMAERILAAKK